MLTVHSIITCREWQVGSGGMVTVEYTKGGVAVVLAPTALLASSGVCDAQSAQSGVTVVYQPASASSRSLRVQGAYLLLVSVILASVLGQSTL